jgi:poly-beta-1,6-N-acetyl-D-glucosamine synthase
MFLLLLYAFAFVTILQILIWFLFPARWAFAKNTITKHTNGGDALPAATILLCARNEAHNLVCNLPLLLQQSYPAPFEVLLVDDDSSDDTEAVAQGMMARFAHLRYLPLRPKKHPGKKMALQTGIRAARYPTLLLTDADCSPATDQWLTQMATTMPTGGLVLGYAPLEHTSGAINTWARFEAAYTAMQYFATSHAGWPFMGVGRNMALDRNLFESVGGFEQHMHIMGGDDDLLVNSAATRHNTGICLAPQAFVYSPAKATLRGWLSQKQRHLAAGLGYKFWHNLVLGGVAFSHAVHYGLGAILLLFAPQFALWVGLGYLLRLAIVWPVYAWAFVRLKERDLAWWVPLLDGLLAVWVGAIAPFFLLFFKKKTW